MLTRMRSPHKVTAQKQRGGGVAAVEFALALPVMLVLLAVPLYLGWYLYHQTVAQAAALNATRYLSRIPASEIINPNRAAAVAAVAREIAGEMLAELRPGSTPPAIDVECNGSSCVGASRPATVGVTIQITVEDIFYPSANRNRAITVSAKLPYLGR